jgi:hypothetical protein
LLGCLLPVSGKAFNIDDTLFLYVARQITHHPLDPFGFKVNWFIHSVPVAYETKNPPFASYYLPAAASIVGWSERALHLAFLLPALAALWGTYRLARRFTDSPLLAAMVTLLAPGFLVSANSVMCDVMMLAFWLWAIIFWMDGLEPEKPSYLAFSALLITLSALTKYFGAALILLLAAYSLARMKKLGSWAWYLALPILSLTDYQQWTKSMYGLRMITDAAHFSTGIRRARQTSIFAKALVDLSFTGGCTLPALMFAPLLWARKKILAVCAASAVAAFFIATGRLSLGDTIWPLEFYGHPVLVGIHLTLFMAAGFGVMVLVTTDAWKRRDADSLLLLLWAYGTFIFTGFVNWTINARSILPLIPAVGILIARRMDAREIVPTRWRDLRVTVPLALAGAISLWLMCADTELANSQRTAATFIAQKTRGQPGAVWFSGHWGFQYYMESIGAQAVSVDDFPRRPGDFLVIAAQEQVFDMRPEFVNSREVIEIPLHVGITPVQSKLGAGFYSSDFGPLPFAIGPTEPQRYDLMRLALPTVPSKTTAAP